MLEPLDQSVEKTLGNKKSIFQSARFWNTIVLILTVIFIILVPLKVKFDRAMITTGILPDDVLVFKNGVAINLALILIIVLIPAIFLRIKKKYVTSSLFLFTLTIMGILVSRQFTFYEWFYGIL